MRIVTLSTYPVKIPLHGGQHRVSNIVRLLQEAGHEVQSCGVLGADAYPATEGFVPYPGSKILSRYLAEPAFMEDWALGRLVAEDDRYFKQLSGQIGAAPDVIFCEQPWLFAFAARYRDQFRRNAPKLVYGSANIESQLKYAIVEKYLGKERAARYSELVLATETQAAQGAELIIAVSEHDQQWLAQRTSAPIVLAANGVRDRRASLADLRAANALTEGRKFALYCASDHPPNIQGFFDIFKNGVGCIPPECRLVVAGPAGARIQGSPEFHRAAGLGPIYADAGTVSEAQLSGLLHAAHVVILPITQGGGTNLKTAEAIWTGRHVVATAKAMRGFEQYEGTPGVAVANTPSGFLRNVRSAFEARPIQLTPDERHFRSSVLWESTLVPLVRSVSELGN